MKRLSILLLLLSLSTTAITQAQPARPSASINRVKSTLAPIMLDVDASDAPRKILHAKLVIPASPGPLVLLYPKWIPGEHGPTGPIIDMAGLKISAAGRPLSWQRDLVEMYALHCDVPAGANAVDVSLDFLLAAAVQGFSSGASATAQLAVINWNQLLLYPQGSQASELTYTASLRLPAGWKYGTALPVATTLGETITFKPVSLTTLVDSPVITGANFRIVPLMVGDSPSHEIDMASDSTAALEMSPELIADYKQLVAETGALFGARHYQKYHFLYTLSDHVASFGLEHHESSDDRVPERTLLDDSLRKVSADLLPHEFVHSWNGKYRRPADLTTPDYQQPMRTDLLWVYEGLTHYLGYLLAARSGLWTNEEYREFLAWDGAYLDQRAGRTWRPLADTAIAAQLLYNAAAEWATWRRGVDFYDEGVLIWLETDVVIRQQTQGRRSLNDFCRRFHGGQSGPPTVRTYTFDDVVAVLNEVAPYDWRSFFTTRLNSTDPRAPLGGMEGSGWRLVYNETPNDYLKASEQAQKATDLSFSLGLRLHEDGTVSDIIPGKVAEQAGIAPGMKIIAVNNRRWSQDVLRDAVRASKTATGPLELLIENGEFYKTYRLNYHEGERYPHLERDAGRPDLLTQILKPLANRVVPGTPVKP